MSCDHGQTEPEWPVGADAIHDLNVFFPRATVVRLDQFLGESL